MPARAFRSPRRTTGYGWGGGRRLARPGRPAGDPWRGIPVSTALSKIERGSSRDIDDVVALVRRGDASLPQLEAAFEEILPRVERESLRVDPDDFDRKFRAVLALLRDRREG